VGSECNVGKPKGAESKTNGENSTLDLIAVAAERAAVNPGRGETAEIGTKSRTWYRHTKMRISHWYCYR